MAKLRLEGCTQKSDRYASTESASTTDDVAEFPDHLVQKPRLPRNLPGERSCADSATSRMRGTESYRQVSPAPSCSKEKLASVTMVFPLVRFPLVETIRLANGVNHSRREARTS
jgi:hypothetical protein